MPIASPLRYQLSNAAYFLNQHSTCIEPSLVVIHNRSRNSMGHLTYSPNPGNAKYRATENRPVNRSPCITGVRDIGLTSFTY